MSTSNEQIADEIGAVADYLDKHGVTHGAQGWLDSPQRGMAQAIGRIRDEVCVEGAIQAVTQLMAHGKSIELREADNAHRFNRWASPLQPKAKQDRDRSLRGKARRKARKEQQRDK